MQKFHPEVTNVSQAIFAILSTLKEIPWIFGMTALGGLTLFSYASILSKSTSDLYINQLKELVAMKFTMM
jgi:hypothetical protein